MNPRLSLLNPYPFEKLAALKAPCKPPHQVRPLDISIGEPKHPVAPFILAAMGEALGGISVYPTTRGMMALRRAAAGWLERRFALGAGGIDPERQLLPVNGTREALFSIAQAVVDATRPRAAILTPNPFYQIYEGAAFMAGAEPIHVDATAASGYLPDYENLPPALLDRVQLAYLCTPSNPTGAVYSQERLQRLIELAHRHDFVLCSDECYSEIWYDAPPAGLLQAARAMGLDDYRRCLVFHSLSKRSNMPGARSGFVAGDATLLEQYFKLRTYTGCATPPFVQQAAIAAWNDEAHVAENRRQYQAKLEDSLRILEPVLPVGPPDAGFYLWIRVPEGGEAFARTLYDQFHVTVLPGAYLGRPNGNGINPGADYIRVALVASREDNREAMKRIAMCAESGCSV